MLWDVMRCYEMFFKVTANISRSNRQGLFNDLSASLGCLKEKEFERLDFILIIVPVSFSFRRKSTCPMSPQYVPSLTSKKRSFTENSHDVFFKHQSSYWQKEVQNLILATKKKCKHVLLKSPTNQLVNSFFLLKELKKNTYFCRLNGPFTIWRSSGWKVAHDNLALKGKQPFQGGGVGFTLRQGLNSAAFIWHPLGGSRYFYEANQLPPKKRHQIKHQTNQNQRIFETFDLCSFPTKSCRLLRKSPQKIVGGVFLPEDPLN